MDAGRQIIRWSIPGALFVLTIALAQMALQLAWSVPGGIELSKAGSAAVALGIASTIPVGFAISQLYYWFYSPTWFFGRFVTRDRGRFILEPLLDRGRVGDVEATRNRVFLTWLYGRRIDFGPPTRDAMGLIARIARMKEVDEKPYPIWRSRRSQMTLGLSPRSRSAYRIARRQYRDTAFENWNLVSSLLDVIGVGETSRTIRSDYTARSDIFHALGASRLAMVIALVASTTFNAVVHRSDIVHHVAATGFVFGLLGLVALGVALALHFARRQAWQATYGILQRDVFAYFRLHFDRFGSSHDGSEPSTQGTAASTPAAFGRVDELRNFAATTYSRLRHPRDTVFGESIFGVVVIDGSVLVRKHPLHRLSRVPTVTNSGTRDAFDAFCDELAITTAREFDLIEVSRSHRQRLTRRHVALVLIPRDAADVAAYPWDRLRMSWMPVEAHRAARKHAWAIDRAGEYLRRPE